MGGTATFDPYGPGRDLNLISDERYALLERCLDYYEADAHIFVHANYFADIPMDEQHFGMLRWESVLQMTPGPHLSGKTVLVGHTPQRSGEILDLGHVKCIDTHCHGGGWLTAFDVQTGELWQADRRENMCKDRSP
jgi:serine/threonine protein phosphatase 1